MTSDTTDNQQQITEIPEEPDYKQKAEEYLNNWKRERADFMNYKKHEAKRVQEIVKFGNEGVIMELIEVLDRLDLGLRHEPNETIKQLAKDFEKFLEGYDVKRIEIKDKFDPMLHEAIEVEEGGQKVEEVRAGYTMHDRVIRPARVRIIK